jgi:hypothetical protein
MQFLVVNARSTQQLAKLLVRAMKKTSLEVGHWDEATFMRHRSHVSGETRVLFVGENKVSALIRKMITPTYHKHGVQWGIHKRMGLLWTVDDIVDRNENFEEMNRHILELAEEGSSRSAMHLATSQEANGAAVALAFLTACEGIPRPAYRKPRFDELYLERQFMIGIASLLIEAFDGWCAVHLTPAPAESRVAVPGQDQRHGSFVSYRPSVIRNPNSTVPPTPREKKPSYGLAALDSLKSQLGNLEVDMAKARIAIRKAEEAGKDDSRKFQLMQKQMKNHRTRRSVLRRQLEELLDR